MRAANPPYIDTGDLDLLARVIAMVESTDPESWWPGPTFRSPDGTQHCVLAHIEDQMGMTAMEQFEETWSNSYVIGLINDGEKPGYQQATPKERCMAYLENLSRGVELSILEEMDLQYRQMEDTP